MRGLAHETTLPSYSPAPDEAPVHPVATPPVLTRHPRRETTLVGIPRVLVVSDDLVIRHGLETALTHGGITTWSIPVSHIAETATSEWDHLIVWLDAPHGVDPFAPISAVRGLPVDTATTSVIGLHAGPLTDVVRLRLAEAGFRYLVPLRWLTKIAHDLSILFTTESVPSRFHLETPAALRKDMGLAPEGSIDDFLVEALAVPLEVWTGHLPQSHLPISRTDIRRLRRLALRVAGVPAPPFGSYSTSAFRAPPDTPEWGRIRHLVRGALNLRGNDA